jgi:hypothetical protein
MIINKEDYAYINIITSTQVHLITHDRQIIFLHVNDTVVDGLTFSTSVELKNYLGLTNLTFQQLDILFPPE